MKDFAKLCTPAKIYFAIAVIASIVALFNRVSILAIFFKLVFAFIWTFILGCLCKKGFTAVSWFLVLLPYIVMVLALIGFMRLSAEQRAYLNAIKLQGAYGQEHFTNK
jgi:ABC-type uncharacterized transport system permease subunit